jgi:hypothetical protein
MPSKRNGIIDEDIEKEETDGRTVHSLTLMHFQSTGLQGVEGCFDHKLPHREDQPLPLLALLCDIMITGLKKANEYGVVY